MMSKTWAEKTEGTGRCSVINLNKVNLSSSTLKMINSTSTTTSIPQLNRPTLLRRSRASGPRNNPLLNHFLLGDASGVSNNAGIVTSANLQQTPASELLPVSAILRKIPSAPLEEIIIWQPETSSECEIVEVEPGDLSQYLVDERKEPGMDIQEIIVYSNQEEEDEFGNYVVQVFQESPVEELAFDADNSAIPDCPPPPSSIGTKKVRKSRTKELISPLLGTNNDNHNDVTAPARPKKRRTPVIIKCLELECDVMVHSVLELRFHLEAAHGMSFHEENIHFESPDVFKRWRTAYEQEHKVSFIYRGGTKKISAEKAVTYLICHRSGIYKPTMTESFERKRKLKPQGSCKIGTQCTAGIRLVKYLTGTAMDATVCHTHYGHDLNVKHLRLTGDVKEKVLQKFNDGLSFSEVLQYIHHNMMSIDGLRLVDRRAIRNIYDQWRKVNTQIPTNQIEEPEVLEEVHEEEHLLVAVESSSSDLHQEEESVHGAETEKCHGFPSNASTVGAQSDFRVTRKRGKKGQRVTSRRRKMTPVDTSPNIKDDILDPPPSLDSIVARLQEHCDPGSCPTVLLYKKGGERKPEIGDLSRLLRLESMCLVIQTPIQRQLLENFSQILHLELVQGTTMDILVVVVLDEFLMAIPVAWMISNAATDQLIENFFQILRINCVGLNCDYLFATRKSALHQIWSKVFTRKARILYPQEDVFRELKIFLRKYYDEVVSRGSVYDILEKMVLSPEKAKFDDGLRSLKQKAKNSDFLNSFMTQWLEVTSRWAFHTRTQIHPAMEDSFLKLRKFILFKGTKSLDKNILDILKIGYDKCFQHDKSLFKGDIKLSAQLDSVHQKHCQGSESCWSVARSGGKYTLNGEFEVFDLQTICQCMIRCESCDMCAHRLLCSCGDALFCVHVHAVKFFLDLNPLQKDDVESKSADVTEVSWTDDSPEVPMVEYDEVQLDNMSRLVATCDQQSVKPAVPKGETMRDDLDGNDKMTEPLPGMTEGASTTDPPRRISTRLKQKMKGQEPSSLPIGGKRGWNQTSFSLSQPEDKRSSTFSLPSEDEAIRMRLGKMKKNARKQENLRDEMLRLINQIESIHDPKVLNQVKKRVSSLSNLLQK